MHTLCAVLQALRLDGHGPHRSAAHAGLCGAHLQAFLKTPSQGPKACLSWCTKAIAIMAEARESGDMLGGDSQTLAEAHVARSWCLIRSGNHRRALIDLEAAEHLAPQLPALAELQERLAVHRRGTGSDYYKVLGVPKGASLKDVQKACRCGCTCDDALFGVSS